MNVMRSSRLFRVSLLLEYGSILMIWGCFSIVSNVIRSNYCCRRHTMHGNMVFSRDSIFPTPQQSGCLHGCSVDCIFYHFRSIPQLILCDLFSQNGHWWPFLMSENHFRSHFWPFQIDRPFWMSKIHFRSYFWPFQIDTELFFFSSHIRCHFRSHFSPFQIDRPFWVSEIHFRSHFWLCQIDPELFYFVEIFDKMAAGGHFGWDDNINYRTRPRYLNEQCMCQD